MFLNIFSTIFKRIHIMQNVLKHFQDILKHFQDILKHFKDALKHFQDILNRYLSQDFFKGRSNSRSWNGSTSFLFHLKVKNGQNLRFILDVCKIRYFGSIGESPNFCPITMEHWPFLNVRQYFISATTSSLNFH